MERDSPNLRSVGAIASRLAQLRTALDMSQAEFCRRCGIARNTYNQYERAKGRPELSNAIAICDAFHVTLDWIYLGDSRAMPLDLAQKLELSRVKIA